MALTFTLIFGHMTLWAESAAGAPVRYSIEARASIPGDPGAGGGGGGRGGNGVLPLPGSNDPSTLYAGLWWSLTEARGVPRSNISITEPDYPVVIAEMTVGNTTSGTTLRVRKSDLAIIWPDGRRDEVDRFEHVNSPGGFALAPGETRQVTVVFKPRVLVDPKLAELRLEIGEPGRIPASFPLVGPALPDPYPIEAPIDVAPIGLDDGAGPGQANGLIPRSAVVDVNAGPYRAAVGQRLVLIDVDVTAAAASNPSTFEADSWALEIGGEMVPPLRLVVEAQSGAGQLPASQLTEEQMPAGQTTLTLVFSLNDSLDVWVDDGERLIDLVVETEPARFVHFGLELPAME